MSATERQTTNGSFLQGVPPARYGSVWLGLAPLQSHSFPAGPGVYPPVDEAELFCEAEVRAHEHPHRVTTR